MREDDITETGYSADGETFFSGSETEISYSDDGLNETSTCKGKENNCSTLKKIQALHLAINIMFTQRYMFLSMKLFSNSKCIVSFKQITFKSFSGF